MTEVPRSDPTGRIKTIAAIAITLAVSSVCFRLLIFGRLEHTSLVFIGIPAILAIVTAMFPVPKTTTGVILQSIALALLLAGVALGEAFVCILFAAPLFFFVGTLIGLFLDYARQARGKPTDRPLTLRSVVLIVAVLAPPSLEGVVPGFELERHETVTATRLVQASANDIATLLAQSPRFDRPLPLFLQLGFPRPGVTEGTGVRPGDVRRVQFLHGHHPGTLVLAVRDFGPGHVDFDIQSDDSYITHWLSWQRSEVRWRPVGSALTEVSWTLMYRRRLDPAWYFAPLERHGVRLAAAYLIDTLATPDQTSPKAESEKVETTFQLALGDVYAPRSGARQKYGSEAELARFPGLFEAKLR